MEITQSGQQTESQIKNKQTKKGSNISDLLDNIKPVNLHRIGIPEEEEREKSIKNVFEEIMAENCPSLKKETDIQLQEAQRVPNNLNPNRSTPRHYNKNGKSLRENSKGSKRKTNSLIQENPHKIIR